MIPSHDRDLQSADSGLTAPQIAEPLNHEIAYRRYLDWIWHIRGHVEAPSELTVEDAIARLSPLFGKVGTWHQRAGDALVFVKKDPAAQDKMSIFSSGVLDVESGIAGPVVRYHLVSKFLLACFIAPFMFLAIAQLTVYFGELTAKPDDPRAEAEEEKKKKKVLPQNPIDKFLGAPAPDDPSKKDKEDKEKKKDKKKMSPTPAYVFAGIFATLYIIGRYLEAWLVKNLFARKLKGH